MSKLLTECERRLRGGVPLRLDQTIGLMQGGIDASMVEQNINGDEPEPCRDDDSPFYEDGDDPIL